MERQKKKQKGITLIALVISIIVMLILAGVSLNMTIGENGIISQAQNATYQNSIAMLQDYIDQEYVQNYDLYNEAENKITQFQNIRPSYFYIPSAEGMGYLKYIVDSEGHALYLFKKSGLPREIRESLVGGDAGEGTYTDYATLNDVYGITENLKVYYSASTGSELLGISSDDLDIDNPVRTVFSNSNSSQNAMFNLISDYDVDGDGTISAEEAKSIKTLTIDSSSGITNLTDLYDLPSLTELTIVGKNFANLSGIQYCTKLYYLYFKSSTIGDYSAMSELGSRLRYLYIYDIDDTELETLCRGISKAEFSNLNYFAIVGGNTVYISSSSKETSSSKSTKQITTLAPLKLLSNTTKKAIKYLSLQNESVTGNLKDISDFTNTLILRVEYNNLNSLSGIENFTKLTTLIASNNQIGKDCDGDVADESKDGIAALKNCTKLNMLYLERNPNLKQVGYLSTCTAIKNLYLAGCDSNMSVNSISSIILACGTNYSLPCKFLTGSVYDASTYYDTSKVTYEELYSDLYQNQYIKALNIANCKKLTDEQLNTILKSMKSIQFLRVDNTNLSTLSFISTDGCQKITELDLRNTFVVDLTPLKNNEATLRTLRLNGGNVNLSAVQDVLSNLRAHTSYYWTNHELTGLNLCDWSTMKLLEGCTSLTTIDCLQLNVPVSSSSMLDLTGLTSLKTVNISGWRFVTKLPPSIEYIRMNQSEPPIFAVGTTLSNTCFIDTVQGISSPKTKWENFFKSLATCTSINKLDISRPVNFSFSYLNNTGFTGSNVKEIYIHGDTFNSEVISSIYGIENLTGIKQLDLSYHKSVSDWDNLNKLTNLECLTISNNNITNLNCIDKLTKLTYLNAYGNTLLSDISAISSLTNLEELYLSGCSISNLRPLKVLTKLNFINLQNNSIYDTTSYYDENNKIVTENNLEILANLHKSKSGNLEYLYLLGNSGIADFSPVESLPWIEKSGF